MNDMIHARQSHSIVSSREQEYLAGWQRERAELQNFRKRMQEQATHGQRRALRAVVVPLLDIADNFHAALAHIPAELEGNAWVVGISHIARQVTQVLAEYGVVPIEALGKPFDPTRHEAVEVVSAPDVPSGHVVEVVASGYQLADEVIRPAKVKTAK